MTLTQAQLQQFSHGEKRSIRSLRQIAKIKTPEAEWPIAMLNHSFFPSETKGFTSSITVATPAPIPMANPKISHSGLPPAFSDNQRPANKPAVTHKAKSTPIAVTKNNAFQGFSLDGCWSIFLLLITLIYSSETLLQCQFKNRITFKLTLK